MVRGLGYLEWLKLSFSKYSYKISENRYQIGTAAEKGSDFFPNSLSQLINNDLIEEIFI